MRSDLYPLRFQPVFRRYLWGGRRLATSLHKPIGEGNDYAESWEVVDHGQDQSIVLAGLWQGRSLAELMHSHGRALLGRHHPQRSFPLLFKFLDANQPLSVQVHPNDQQGAQLDKPDLGKTEAWVIIEAEPGSKVYAGFKDGVDRNCLGDHISRSTCEQCLHSFEPQVGDCIFLPAGVVHAIGAGLLIAEIQQSSDTTFRLYDWNRTGPDGKPRPLHIQQALQVIDFAQGPIEPRRGFPEDESVVRLVACDKFVLERRLCLSKCVVGGDKRFHILAVLEGEVSLEGDPLQRPLTKGETALLPAELGAILLDPHCRTVLLDTYLP